MSTNEIKKKIKNKKITIKRKGTSFEKKNWEDNLKFWIEGKNWKKKIKLTNESIIK